ncbi:type IV pilus secretin PilQ [Microbulbifer halophilus]|uniref:Type IV pilus secretin PilQ n=1 Tax=Microbulbifer halophilus TaxID=453963 RepID=A0ABW5EB13_9GAMM|nr:type IV pilus secretin PilQ [Microbulbifer halophilus]MCW8126685.1 type IV pilus secretin PilQ [Microbulbifer halophilus]
MINRQLAKVLAPARVLLLGLAMMPAVLMAQGNQLNDIQFSELPGSRVQLRLTFSDVPPEPTGYTIEEPARIVMDFAGVESALTEKKYSLGIGAARSAVVVSSDDRTRLIVNLDELPVYTSERQGNQVLLEIGADSATTASVTAAPAEQSRGEGIQIGSEQRFEAASNIAIDNVDFRRGEKGEGKVIVSLSDPAVNIDVERTKGKILLTFLGADLPEELRQRLDVTDFATPVSSITVDHDGRNTVIAVDPSDSDYDYLAYQADNEYVLSVKPLTVAEVEEKKKEFRFTGEKLSLNFQDIEVRSVLQLIADFTDLNLVASDTVSGRITLRLDGVPWDQALELILKAKGLDKRQEGNVIMVAPAAEIAERERQELETRKQLQELAPLRTEYIQVRYADARELFTLFSGQQSGGGGGGQGNFAGGQQSQKGRSILSDRGNAIVDERTNTIILTDTEDKIAQFRELIEAIDIPIRQVMIEARIVNANTDFLKEVGVRWNYGEHHGLDGGGIGEGTGSLDGSFHLEDNREEVELFDPQTGEKLVDADGEPIEAVAWAPELQDTLLTDLGVNNPAGNIAYSILKNNFFVGLELSALENVGRAEIVSQPKVVTGDKQEANIKSGVELPYLEATSSGAASVTFRQAVLELNVTPQITPDNNIIMNLNISQDTVGELVGTTGIPAININSVDTKVLVRDGETIVLGGIFENTMVDGETKIPLLGDIPYLGHLFKNTVRQDDKREMLVFITPRIMEDELFYSGGK